MDESEKQVLAGLMARMAVGEELAAFELYERFGKRIAGLILRHTRRLGVYRVDTDELDGLVIDTCLMLLRVAGGWDPEGGALPWNWAGHRVANIVSGWVGQHGVEYDADRHSEVVREELQRADDDLEEIEVLEGLRATHPGCDLLFEALGQVASTRDRHILLAVRVQAATGDPSPAVTVARELGMRPDAVRQVAHRVRTRLKLLAATDGRFAPLGDMALLAG